MKENRLTKLGVAGLACAFALGSAFAQDSSTTTTTTAGATGATTSVSTSSMDGTGTITTFSPDGNMMTVRTATSAQPTMYYYTPQTVVVDSAGAPVRISMLRPDMPVTYTYVKEGDRMIISKVTLQQPISFYETKQTTTTTTTTNGKP